MSQTDMEPYRYLETVSHSSHSLQTKEEITKVLEEVEFLYEALDPKLQSPADQLISVLK